MYDNYSAMPSVCLAITKWYGVKLMEFTQQSVRDLAWAISSPPLMSQMSSQCIWPQGAWYQQLYSESLPWIKRLDNDSSELEELIAEQKDRRLGKYFETLWYFWLCKQSRYDIVENNVQINIDGETLGELDFVLFDNKEKKTLHWELAVKFYLGVGDTREMYNWYGPNRRDRLDKKVEHLLSRQSVISQDARVVQWLAAQGIKIDRCAVIMKGRLYFPCPAEQAAESVAAMLPLKCSPDLLHGWWLTPAGFEAEFDEQQHFLPLINSGWLAKISTESSNEYYAKRGILEAVSNGKMRYPLHLQVLSHCSSWDKIFIAKEK